MNDKDTVVVPREATAEMIEVAVDLLHTTESRCAEVWSAMLAAAPSTSVREEELRSIDTAPKDGSYILALFQPPEGSHADYLSGRAFVIRHEGMVDDYDLGWSGFPGYGGVRSASFAGWLPLPAALKPSTDKGGVE